MRIVATATPLLKATAGRTAHDALDSINGWLAASLQIGARRSANVSAILRNPTTARGPGMTEPTGIKRKQGHGHDN